jgi:MSHA biogenesis protein MshL
VIIIGGLMKEAVTEEDASVPVLGDIPLFGSLFRHKKMARIKKELVILLKPSVINHNSDWDQQISDTRYRTQELQRLPRPLRQAR